MNVAFYFHSAESEEKKEQSMRLMNLSVRSVRKHMPDAVVWHLKGPRVDKFPGVDDAIEYEPRHRPEHHAMMKGDTIFLDIDTVVQDDLSHVFDTKQPFDVAVALRPKLSMRNVPKWNRIPYNWGVSFTRSADFWRGASKMLADEGWPWNEAILCRYAQTSGSIVMMLRGERYNYTPATEDEDVSTRAVVHYKGNRKHWMLSRVVD